MQVKVRDAPPLSSEALSSNFFDSYIYTCKHMRVRENLFRCNPMRSDETCRDCSHHTRLTGHSRAAKK